ncbi:glutaredoxin 3 [Alphaproteobacteria bacterium]|jgi:glutaredoxin 3|nr:glutaredoxin 3 [Alphaproteobacteria bacterium]
MSEAPNIEIYTAMACGYCARAKRLLESKGVNFHEIDVSMSSKLRGEMRSRSGGRQTVPQIFLDGEHIGDCDELFKLEQAGHLDKLLKMA